MKVIQAVRSALSLLDRRDRRLLIVAGAFQMSMSVLDLVGVLLIGLVGALAVTTIQSQPPPATVTTVADTLGWQSLSPQGLVIAFSVAAAVVLLSKSVVSSIMTRRVLVFLANRQALVSARLCRQLLSRPLTFVKIRSSQETAFALINGAAAATSQILGQLVIAATEVALLLVLSIALLWVSPWIALAAILFFSLVALGLQRALGNWASRVGKTAAEADIASLNTIQEALSAYREVTVSNRRGMYVERFQQLRWRAASVAADTQFIALFPKYMFEAALVLGGFALAAFLFATQPAVSAVATFALFIAAGTRVMPSLLRLQGAALGLRSAAGLATPTFALAEELDRPRGLRYGEEDVTALRARMGVSHEDFTPEVEVCDVYLTYSGAKAPAAAGISLEIPAGISVGLVGPSGAGKTTLSDLLLGVLLPDSGNVSIGGLPPADAVEKWPGGIAYVPQEIVLAQDTLRANVALGLPKDLVDDDAVWRALDRARLLKFVQESHVTLDTPLGPGGVTLSGGQRQRVGIARALYTNPRLLVLDEATSSLDVETEAAISAVLQELEGAVTTIVIAHRLSTIRDVDLLLYMEHGQVLASGSFEEVLKESPAFRRQVSLARLDGSSLSD